ncbi:MAG: 1-phosphofructokinase family hexose kinase [Gemmatimonadota bacterium]
MIVTVTLNPALHVQYRAARLALGESNQLSQASSRAGGHGLAIARVLQAFGHDVLAAGLAGGATGELIRTDLARSGVPARFTSIGRESRRVIEITDAAGQTTGFTEPAPYITTEEVGRLAADYRGLLADAVAVVLSGSLPAGLPPEIYGTLATYAADAGVPAVIDAGGTELAHGLGRRPALVIPGPGGAGPASGLDAAALLADGVGALVTVTAGEVRAVTADGQWRAAPPGDPGRPGAREALVAGLIPGLLVGWPWPDRLRHAAALAAAVLPSGEVDLEAYERLLPAVPVSAC